MKSSHRSSKRKHQAVVLCSLLLLALASMAQPISREQNIGFKTTFGAHTSMLFSDIEEINQTRAQFQGGSIGIFKGSEVFRYAVSVAGFYYSADNMARTVDLVYSDATLSFFPLAVSNRNSRIQPYVSSGVGLSRLKFYGHYLKEDPGQPINYSAPEPYLGKHRSLSALLTVGLEYRIPAYNFVTIFAEVAASKPFLSTADPAFQNTSVVNARAVHIGIAFGSKK
jgi:hypothetical protein